MNQLKVLDLDALAELASKGDYEATGFLFSRLHNLFKKMARDFMAPRNVSLNYFDDFYDVICDSFLEASSRYKKELGLPFLNYFWSIAKGRMGSYYHRIVESKVFYFPPETLEEFSYQARDVELLDNEHHQISLSEVRRAISENKADFTRDEKLYLDTILRGLENSEVTKVVGWSKSKVYRVRKKALGKIACLFK